MIKQHVRMEGWVVVYRDSQPWFLTGYATGHPKLPGFRRFIHSSEIERFDEQRGVAETLNTIYALQHKLEDLFMDDEGLIREARIRDVTASRGDLPGEWLISRSHEVIDRLWGTPFYDVVPKVLALVSESPRN